jgi:amino-acid N-acetyltransferase
MTTVEVEVALPADRPDIEDLLAGSGLPLDGLGIAISTAVVARADDVVVGCAAVEPYGSFGLLRSVCVVSDLRGTGVGRQLVEAATRDAIPEALGASPEVAGACPQSAAVLHKRL